jgi:hypothetical protein
MLLTVTIALSLVLLKVGLAVTLVLTPAVWMVMLFGSSSQAPPCPAGAEASTMPVDCSTFLLLVSTNPPLPAAAPPRAEIVPLKSVYSSDQRTTLPPSPEPQRVGLDLRALRHGRC